MFFPQWFLVRVHRSTVAAFVLFIAVSILAMCSWPPSVSAASGDIVLYPTDVTTIQGAWTRVSSTTGAGGQLMNSVDAGWSTMKPLATPQNYFEASFDASANTPYHVCLRLRAADDSLVNDSV